MCEFGLPPGLLLKAHETFEGRGQKISAGYAECYACTYQHGQSKIPLSSLDYTQNPPADAVVLFQVQTTPSNLCRPLLYFAQRRHTKQYNSIFQYLGLARFLCSFSIYYSKYISRRSRCCTNLACFTVICFFHPKKGRFILVPQLLKSAADMYTHLTPVHTSRQLYTQPFHATVSFCIILVAPTVSLPRRATLGGWAFPYVD